MGLIYKIQNRESGKIYIGQTTRTLEVRMKEHLYNSIHPRNKSYIDIVIGKYGIDAFEVSIIEECNDEEKLNEREIYWIAFYNCKRPNGYNLTDGGEGCTGFVLSEETRAKISKANKGRKNPISPETRKKIIASRIANKKPVSAETRAKISAAHKGKKLSPEICAKMSAGNKRKRAVVCIETGQVFESLAAAAGWLNISSKLISKAVNGILAGAGGYHWRFADADVKDDEVELKPLKAVKRPVRCVETGQIFPSIRSAAKWVNLVSDTIKVALNHPTRTAGNYHWCDADSEMDETAMISPKDRLHAVKCVETGQIFESLATAAKFANVYYNNILCVLNQSKRTAGGYHWVDAN